MKRVFLFIAAAFFLHSLQAQQLIQNSQYMLNLYDLNPAYAGSREGMPLSFSYRKLWTGFEGTPSIQNLSAHMEVAERMGVGAKLFNYTAGPLRRTGFEGTYAYHLPMGNGPNKLSFGLSGLVYQYFLDVQNLNLENPNDPLITGASEKMIVPDVSFGTYFYGPDFYVGLAIPQLFSRRIDLKTDRVLEQRQVRHYFLHGGYRFAINDEFKLEPSLLLKFIEQGQFQADINLRASYLDMVSLGVSYRTADAVSVMIGYHHGTFLFGYAYDITVSDVRTVSGGSHELMLVYTIGNFLK